MYKQIYRYRYRYRYRCTSSIEVSLTESSQSLFFNFFLLSCSYGVSLCHEELHCFFMEWLDPGKIASDILLAGLLDKLKIFFLHVH